MTESFEETYRKYPFSRLVWFGLRLASFAVSRARKRSSKSEITAHRINQHHQHRTGVGLDKVKRQKA